MTKITLPFILLTKKWLGEGLDGITRSVHCKFNCITVNLEKIQPCIYLNYRKIGWGIVTSWYTGRETGILDSDFRETCIQDKDMVPNYTLFKFIHIFFTPTKAWSTVDLLSLPFEVTWHNQLITEHFYTKLCNKECYHLNLNFTTWCFLTGVDRTYVPKWTESPPPF